MWVPRNDGATHCARTRRRIHARIASSRPLWLLQLHAGSHSVAFRPLRLLSVFQSSDPAVQYFHRGLLRESMTLAELGRYHAERVPSVGDRAVVVGGSIAGLCAARVLADGFEQVVVLERDRLPDEPAARDGAPQTSHPHALLEAGRATLEDLFPGFGELLLSAGGLLVDAGTEMDYYAEGGFVADTRTRLPTYTASRALFEHVVRTELAAVEDVEVRDERQVTGYRTDERASSVTGVEYRGPSGTGRSLPADLVVDATGRTSRTPAWLADNGYDAPSVDEVAVDVTYSTVRIDRPPGDRRLLFVPPSPPRTRGGALFPVEDGQWEAIVQGLHGDETPDTRRGFVEYAGTLPVPEFADIVDARPWTSDGVDCYPYPSSRRHHYEDLSDLPDGLLVTGDAVASFNPIYGQGMSVAALDALALHHALRDDPRELSDRFFDRVADVVDVVWQLAVGNDFAFPETTGPEPRGTATFNWYVTRLLRRAHDDPVLTERFLRVLRLEDDPVSLLRPGVAWRVLRPSIDFAPPTPVPRRTDA